MGMLDVRSDLGRNRLYVTLSGFLTDREMEEGIARVIAELPRMKPGFVMVSNIADLKPTTPNGAKTLAKAMEAYKQHRIARIVRIIGKEVLGKMQFQRVAQEAGVPVDYVHSAADAEALLARA